MVRFTKMFCYFLFFFICNNAAAGNLSWNPAVDLTFNLPAQERSASSPQIVLSSDGTRATAVWSRKAGSGTIITSLGDIIQSASATINGNSATWSSANNLTFIHPDAEDPQVHSEPQVSLSGDGSKATAIWIFKNNTDGIYTIKSSSATIDGNTAVWSAATDLTISGRVVKDPQISLSSDGSKATAVWSESNGTNLIIQARSATIIGNIASWESTFDLSAPGKNAFGPQLALSMDGAKATVVWMRGANATDIIIQGASATINGNLTAWSLVMDLSAATGISQSPQVALSSQGDKVTAVWKHYNGQAHFIKNASATIIGNTASWSAASNLPSVGGLVVEKPQISVSSDGTKATAVWQNKITSSTYIIQSASASITGNTAIWSPAIDISATGSSRDPQISLSSDGAHATAVWTNNSIIQSSSAIINGDSGSWNPAADLSVLGGITAIPQVSLSSDGTSATAVWILYSGTTFIIQSASGIADTDSCYTLKSKNGKTVVFCL